VNVLHLDAVLERELNTDLRDSGEGGHGTPAGDPTLRDPRRLPRPGQPLGGEDIRLPDSVGEAEAGEEPPPSVEPPPRPPAATGRPETASDGKRKHGEGEGRTWGAHERTSDGDGRRKAGKGKRKDRIRRREAADE